jgi:hypothetical protein
MQHAGKEPPIFAVKANEESLFLVADSSNEVEAI